VLAIRPEDLTPRADGPIRAVVQQAEYRGRDFSGVAVTAVGTELYFQADRKVAIGETLCLGADPDRVLVYAS
jgi:putative spermidine/putrescine transport system ATP-binding protein